MTEKWNFEGHLSPDGRLVERRWLDDRYDRLISEAKATAREAKELTVSVRELHDAIRALDRVISENGPAISAGHPEDHGLDARTAAIVVLLRGASGPANAGPDAIPGDPAAGPKWSHRVAVEADLECMTPAERSWVARHTDVPGIRELALRLNVRDAGQATAEMIAAKHQDLDRNRP